ncbi:hypothetical protein AVEN_260848-1 [Araneus ventricosus]|uniref:Uncharacterized protein n=1 Tax=Araneus ventricosus TaxID=182803 RepID=A0A4Y2P202_ARAVE|nr:hypothetical protein AVEN_260848-1 [Araneus ventricosus]
MTASAIFRVLSPSSQSPGHGPSRPEEGKYYHWREATHLQPLLYPPGKREPAYLYGSFSSVNSLCPRWDRRADSIPTIKELRPPVTTRCVDEFSSVYLDTHAYGTWKRSFVVTDSKSASVVDDDG